MMNQFQAEFVITEACNLKCSWCYMSNKNSFMTLDVFRAHLDFLPEILKEYNCNAYAATLFGGEPLLNYNLIKEILPILSRDLKCNAIIMPTNGLLLDQEKLDRLKVYKVNVSWSFNGLWHYNHDDLPKFKKTRKLLPYNTCKAMIGPERRYTLSENYEFFIKEFNMLSPDFSIVRDNIWCQKEVEIYKNEIKELADNVINVNKTGKFSLPSPFNLYLLDTLVAKKYGKRAFGCFSGCHGAAFMPDSRVYPCARYGSEGKLEDALFTTKPKGRFPVTIARFKNPMNTNPCNFDRCKVCELFTYCNAGCTHSQEGLGFKPIPEVCEIFKATYEQAFRIVEELGSDLIFRTNIRKFLKEKSLCL